MCCVLVTEKQPVFSLSPAEFAFFEKAIKGAIPVPGPIMIMALDHRQAQ